MKTTMLKNQMLELFNNRFGICSLKTVICSTLLLTSVQSICPHGSVTSPPSRVYRCYLENPENPDSPACIDAIASHGTQALYDWFEVARMDANDRHRDIISDGNLASAGRPEKYGGLDQVRDDWVATPVSPGPLTITWSNATAPHATLYYEVYITKAEWTPNQPLTWDSLELLTRTGPRPLATEDNIDVILPERKGKHVIYSIWQRSLSQEAFYSTSDVDTSTIKYTLDKEALVNIKIYALDGEEISTVTDGIRSPGDHDVVFNASHLSNGVYFYVFKAGNYTETRRMMVRK